MMASATTLPGALPRSRLRASSFVVEATSDWKAALAHWDGAGTPFQEAAWLAHWYETLGGRAAVRPLIVTAYSGTTGEIAVRLPLARVLRGRLTIIEFADLEITDYNAPALGPAAPSEAVGAGALWRNIRRALPRADLIRLSKMPAYLRGRPNPLTLLRQARPCAANGNLVVTGGDWDAWRYGLEKTVRKELERSWRVFSRNPGATFEIITDPDRAAAILALMEGQQQARMQEKRADYGLDDPAIAAFYRDLVRSGVASDGFVVLSVLRAGDELVASLLGVRNAQTFVMIRISNAGGPWSNCSPGRLIIERTMAALHAQGCRSFDFSIGNYDYKRRFGVQPVPLYDLTEALGLAGMPAAMRATAAGELRKRPELDRKVRGVVGRLARARS